MGNATKILRWLVKETPGKIKRLILGQGGRFEKLLPEVVSRQHLYDRKNKKIISLNVRDEVDASVINQIFTNEDYSISRLKRSAEISAIYNRAIESGKKPLIIDCGGNSGMATRYFKETYPNAHIVCIEPDQNNIHAAKGNNPDSATIKFLAAGVGSERTRANIQDPGQGNWAYRVEASPAGSVEIITINDILAEHPSSEYMPFIIKIDIEGFEDNLFSKNTEWIDSFPLLIIELHDWMLPKQNNSHNFLREMAARNRDFIFFGENVFSIAN